SKNESNIEDKISSEDEDFEDKSSDNMDAQLTTHKQFQSITPNKKIISKVGRTIYNSLEHYWHDLEYTRLTAILLDLQFKLSKTWQSTVLTDDSVKDTNIGTPSSTPNFLRKIFSYSQNRINHEIEIDNYLNEMITPSPSENQITPKRTCLSPETINELLFVKRNSLYCNKAWA
ncbi:7207_t:CDS:2, partial [Scutellospora calospora]